MHFFSFEVKGKQGEVIFSFVFLSVAFKRQVKLL